MKTESLPCQVFTDNQLDIRGLCRTLWQGKRWIIGIVLLFDAIVLLYSQLAPQKWSAIAITERRECNLSGFCAQQQFLLGTDFNDDARYIALQSEISEKSYQEFVLQLSAWDTRRDFWLQSDYYQHRKSNDLKKNAALLGMMINSIKFIAADELKKTRDTVRLAAETAADSGNMLRQYVDFASQRAVLQLNRELESNRAARVTQLKAHLRYQESVTKSVTKQQIHGVHQALLIAKQQGINQPKLPVYAADLPDADLFLLGEKMLQARLKSLLDSGPSYDLSYAKNRAMLQLLEAMPVPDRQFQTYRYLRTPEEPINRDSPRTAFLMMMWGAMGALAGSGVVLIRRPHDQQMCLSHSV